MIFHELDMTSYITLAILLGLLCRWLYKKYATLPSLPVSHAQIIVPTDMSPNNHDAPSSHVGIPHTEGLASPLSPSERPTCDTVLQEQVAAMAEQGMTCVEMARCMSISRGEVQLLLTLRERSANHPLT